MAIAELGKRLRLELAAWGVDEGGERSFEVHNSKSTMSHLREGYWAIRMRKAVS